MELNFDDQNDSDRGLVYNLFISDKSGTVKLASSRVVKGRLIIELDALAGNTGTLLFEFIPLKTSEIPAGPLPDRALD